MLADGQKKQVYPFEMIFDVSLRFRFRCIQKYIRDITRPIMQRLGVQDGGSHFQQ